MAVADRLVGHPVPLPNATLTGRLWDHQSMAMKKHSDKSPRERVGCIELSASDLPALWPYCVTRYQLKEAVRVHDARCVHSITSPIEAEIWKRESGKS